MKKRDARLAVALLAWMLPTAVLAQTAAPPAHQHHAPPATSIPKAGAPLTEVSSIRVICWLCGSKSWVGNRTEK